MVDQRNRIFTIIFYLNFLYILFYLYAQGFSVGGITVWYTDVIYVLLAVVYFNFTTKGGRVKTFGSMTIFLRLFVILIAFTTIISVILYGITIIGKMRLYLPILLTIYSASLLDIERSIKFFKTTIKMAVPAIAIALIILKPKIVWASGELRFQYQILNASSVFVICILTLFVIIFREIVYKKKISIWGIILYFIGIIIIQQHRSTWLFLFVSLTTYIIISNHFKHLKINRIFFQLGVVILIALPIILLYKSDFNPLGVSLEKSLAFISNPEGDPTAEWRILYFQDAIERISNNLILGEGFKSNKIIYINDTATEASPHNMYLALLINYGLIGFLIFTFYMVSSIRKLYQKILHNKDDIIKYSYYTFLISCFIGMIFYGLVYSFEPIMFLIFGLAEL